MKTVCIIGASGKLGRYMVQHCLDRGYKVNSVCRESRCKTRYIQGSHHHLPRRYEQP